MCVGLPKFYVSVDLCLWVRPLCVVCVSVDFVNVLCCLFRSDVCVYGLCMYLCLLPFLSVVCVVNRVCWYWTALRDVPRCPERGCWKPLSYLRGVWCVSVWCVSVCLCKCGRMCMHQAYIQCICAIIGLSPPSLNTHTHQPKTTPAVNP